MSLSSGTPPFYIGTKVEYMCEASSVLIGYSINECLPDQSWALSGHHLPSCLCSDPPSHPLLRYMSRNRRSAPFPENSEIIYECLPPLSLSGSSINTCLQIGQWKFPAPHCR